MENNQNITNKKLIFQFLPATCEEMTAMMEARMSDPFDTAALTILALANYPNNPDESLKMLQYLSGPRELSTYDRQFIKDRFRDHDYVPKSYFDGASPDNNYEVPAPFSITVFTSLYSFQEENYANLYIKSGGADQPRSIKMRLGKDGKWYLWEQFLLAGIREPASSNPWA